MNALGILDACQLQEKVNVIIKKKFINGAFIAVT